jgi:purine-binding chemotaxis protein CheW
VTGAPGDGELRRILHERAMELAVPPPALAAVDLRDVLVFRVGAERYAIDAVEAKEAIPVGPVTPLPGLPAFYRGLIGHQGIVYPLVDVRPLVGAPVDAALSPAQAILFASDERTIAIGVDEVEAFESVDANELAGARGFRYLDVHVLLADARLTIDDRD